MLPDLLLSLLYPVALWLFCITLWKHYINSLKDSASSLPLPPGTVGLPFIGETFHMICQGWQFYKSRKEKYGHIYKTHVMGKPTIRVWGTHNIQQILKNEEMLVTMAWPKSSIEIIGRKSIVASTRKDHNMRRALYSRAFTKAAVQNYNIRLEEIIRKWVLEKCDQVDVIKCLPETRELSLRATVSALLGKQLKQKQLETLTASLNTMAANFFSVHVNIPGTGFNQAMVARESVLKVIREVIHENQRLPDQHKDDVLSVLLSEMESGDLKQVEIEDMLIEGLFSALNGLPSLCCSTLVHLAQYPKVVSRLVEELEDSDLMQSDQCLSLDDLKGLPYLEQVWKEITRSSPPFGGGFREVIKTFELEGYQIPAGWTVLYSIRDNHEAEENFHLHSDFNPDRWQDVKTNAAWMPFGGNGIRSCVGQRFTITFLQQFIVTAVKYSKWELHEANPKFSSFPVLLPNAQLPVVFHHRKLKHSE
ncbi:cytochrome P450 26A1-like [Watersipora subatra]|uniref:cytochrome P450 26A1-like n=1 Tax=Watersipora subatra TaxID=2589382 RepID=UPI00355AF6B3